MRVVCSTSAVVVLLLGLGLSGTAAGIQHERLTLADFEAPGSCVPPYHQIVLPPLMGYGEFHPELRSQ